jgi:hypothetical protein
VLRLEVLTTINFLYASQQTQPRKNKGQIETTPIKNSPTQFHPTLNDRQIFVP